MNARRKQNDCERAGRWNLRKVWMTIGLLAATAFLLPAGPRAQWKTRWEYEGLTGPDRWGDLDREYAACKTGKEQSPIDIQNAEKAELSGLRFEYKSGPLKYLINNGHTIRVNYHDAPGTGNFLIVGDKRGVHSGKALCDGSALNAFRQRRSARRSRSFPEGR
jgi:hypothetical protein